MEAPEVLDRLSALGVQVELVGDRLRLSPGSRVPPELLENLRQHKPQVIALLQAQANVPPKGYRLRYPGPGPTRAEAEEIAEQVEREGVCLVWSTVLGDLVAFYKTEEDQQKIPPGFVPYSEDELRKLWQGGTPLSLLKRVHEAKKLGCRLEDVGELDDGRKRR